MLQESKGIFKNSSFGRWDRNEVCFCATTNNHLKVKPESWELGIHLQACSPFMDYVRT